jgi:hypothetical protein
MDELTYWQRISGPVGPVTAAEFGFGFRAPAVIFQEDDDEVLVFERLA